MHTIISPSLMSSQEVSGLSDVVSTYCTHIKSLSIKITAWKFIKISPKTSTKVILQFISACRDNDGLYVKMGQSMASMDHLLPPPFFKWFSKLQDKAKASPIDKIKKVFQDEVGMSI